MHAYVESKHYLSSQYSFDENIWVDVLVYCMLLNLKQV